jgi:CMP/dCMP kinase
VYFGYLAQPKLPDSFGKYQTIWYGASVIQKHIAINGELGSGKSSVARLLAETHGMRLVSTGDVQRAIAKSLRMSTLETNYLAEKDAMIDAQVDSVTKELGSSEEPIIFDSRMAWKMVPNAFRVRLIVDTDIAAVRLYRERSSMVEGYTSVDEARKAAEDRYQSERKRFFAKYGVDISHLHNYHVVIDTSDASIDEVAREIESICQIESSALDVRVSPELRLSPKRVLPGYDPSQELFDDLPSAPPSADPDPVVAYGRPFVYALKGQPMIRHAIKSGKSLMRAVLLAEGAETVTQGFSAEEYPHKVIRREWITAWEKKNGIRFSRYPTSSAP